VRAGAAPALPRRDADRGETVRKKKVSLHPAHRHVN
jgi:hypothetical protein